MLTFFGKRCKKYQKISCKTFCLILFIFAAFRVILLNSATFCLILLKTLFCLILWINLQPFVEDCGFCWQNGPKRGQAQDWYPNEKIVVVPVFSNGLCCYSEVRGSLPAFMLIMQFFCNIQKRQIILEICRNSKCYISFLLWRYKTLSGAIWKTRQVQVV